MTSSFFGLSSLVGLPIIICYWIGVLCLRKSTKGADWWLMLSGTIISSISMIVAPLSAVLSFTGIVDRTELLMSVMLVIGASSILGSLLFAIGFAMHAARTANLRDRISELEILSLAQATELQRLRDP